MAELVQWVKQIMEKPGVYAVYKVEDIYYMLMGGYMFASAEQAIVIGTFQAEFTAFVNKHYRCKEDMSWHRLIRFYSGDNGPHTVEVFEQLFNSYLLAPVKKSKAASKKR